MAELCTVVTMVTDASILVHVHVARRELRTMASETENFFARRTESLDAPGISKLVRRNTESVFGKINVDYIM